MKSKTIFSNLTQLPTYTFLVEMCRYSTDNFRYIYNMLVNTSTGFILMKINRINDNNILEGIS